MNRDRLNAVVLLLITMVLSISLFPTLTGVGHDKQVFIYGAMTIWKGQIPYKTFFDHKPPLIFLMLALAWPFKAWGYYLLGVLTKWIACLFIYKAAKYNKLSNPWLYPVIFLICLLPPFILMSGLLTREYAACFLAILFSVILMNPGKKYLLSGVLCALVFHMQQEEMILAFPFVMYYLFTKPVDGTKPNTALVFKRVLLMAAGFLLVTAPLIIWIAINGGLTDYWQQSFLFNFFVYESRRPALYKITGTLSILFHTRYMFLVFPLMALHTYYLVKRKNVSVQLACFFTLLISLCVKVFAGRIIDYIAVYHYLLTFSAVVAISAMVIAKESEQYFPKRYLKPLIFVFTAVLFVGMWKNSFSSIRKLKYSATYFQIEELTQQLQDIRNKDGQLFVMGHTPFLGLNNNLNALSPAKWVYTTQYSQHLENFDKDGNVIKEIIAALEKNKTTYVLDFYLKNPVDRKAFQEQWEDYLKKNYTEQYRKHDYILFKRNTNATP
jgi:hypothetical protein